MRQHQSIEEVITAEISVHVWLVRYGISMGRNALIALHEGDFSARLEVTANWCRYWRGPLEGGPYRLRLERIEGAMRDDVQAQSEVRLYDSDGAFELICQTLEVTSVGQGFVQID